MSETKKGKITTEEVKQMLENFSPDGVIRRLTSEELTQEIADFIVEASKEHTTVGNLIYAISLANDKLITLEMIEMAIKDGSGANALRHCPKRLMSQEIVDKVFSESPEAIRYMSDNEEMRKYIKEKHALMAVSEIGSYLNSVPLELQSEKVIRTAFDSNHPASFNQIHNRKFKTLEFLFISLKGFDSRYGDVKNFLKNHANVIKEFRITQKAIKEFITDGAFPYGKWQEDGDADKILKAIKNSKLRIHPKSIEELTKEEVEEFMTEDVARLILNLYGGYRGNVWTGQSFIQYVPKKFFTKDFIERYRELVDYQIQAKREVVFEGVPEGFLNQELVNRTLEYIPEQLEFTPEEFKNSESCQIAVNQDGRVIEFVPNNLRENFYVNVAKSGKGLASIPEENRTDKICTLAVKANGNQLSDVPEDKRNYSMYLDALETDVNSFFLVPKDVVDDEIKVKALITIANNISSYKNKTEGDNVIEAIKRSGGVFIGKLIIQAVEREPSTYKMFLNSGYGDTFRGCGVGKEVAIAAFKADKENFNHIPTDILKEVWEEFLNME